MTRIFNIYGTTEVSSWSTCYAVSEMDLQRGRRGETEREGEGGEREGGEVGEGSVPLGEVMLGTKMEVRDTSSSPSEKVVVQGYGEIYLGKSFFTGGMDLPTRTMHRWRVQSVSPRR